MIDPIITDQMINESEDWFDQLSAMSVNDRVLEEFKLWLEQNPAHQQAYAQVFMCQDENITFPILSGKSGTNDSVAVPNNRRNSGERRNTIMRWGAVAALILITVLGYYTFLASPDIKEYSTQIAEIRKILLEDGSVITLGASSQISVVKFTDTERRISLEKGEALFDIAHDSNKPFIVESGKTEVRVLGTIFNLNRTIDYLAVSLIEGKIEVHQKIAIGALPFFEEEKTVTLHPAQMVRVKENILNYPEQKKIKQMASWVDGRLSYFNVPLSIVISDINRYSRVPLKVEDKSLGDLPVTAVFGTDQIDIMIEGLAQILPVTITRGQNNTYIISSNEKDKSL